MISLIIYGAFTQSKGAAPATFMCKAELGLQVGPALQSFPLLVKYPPNVF